MGKPYHHPPVENILHGRLMLSPGTSNLFPEVGDTHLQIYFQGWVMAWLAIGNGITGVGT